MNFKIIKHIVPIKIRKYIKSIFKILKYRSYLWKYKCILNDNMEKKLILIGTPEHGNLGDHAIAKAELKFLKDYFPDHRIIEITGEHFRSDKVGVKKIIHKNDKIIITGGGFLGSLWILEELMVRDIIKTFPDNKIVIFPQTIYFENDIEGKKIYKESKMLYKNHKNLIICTRDKKSYDLINKKMFNEGVLKSILLPDIVTYLNEMMPLCNRSGLLLCLRDDKERNISDRERKFIEEYASKQTNSISYISTVIPKKVTIYMRNRELENKFKEFRSAKLVITDRLHGMIFAAITGTPCIAMNNTSGKVLGVYQWIKYLKYIYCIDSIYDIPKYIDKLMNMEDCKYDNDYLQEYFQKLVKVI